MSGNDYVEAEGVVVATLPNAFFKVKLNQTNQEILCHISGKMRLHAINVLLGDLVTVQVSVYDATRGRIIKRKKI